LIFLGTGVLQMNSSVTSVSPSPPADTSSVTASKPSAWKRIKRDKWMLLMMLPGLLVFILFKYVPMFGLVAAFQNYKSYLGFFHSHWVGWKNFQIFFNDPSFFQLLRNTVIFGVYKMIFVFPLPIIVALMLNEVQVNWYKRLTQTFIYIPHFISWVVVASLTVTFFASDNGVVNRMMGTNINFLANPSTFRPEIILQQIWKETGWGTIIYLAALSGIDPQLYEAAEIDGAGRWKQMWHVTLPGIRGTVATLFILGMGSFLNMGFEQFLLMLNPLNRSVGDIYDTFVYEVGINQGKLSYTTAVGLFKSVASLILVAISNKVVKVLGEEGLY
jgi:putative aldouronate transport system permease protein